MRQSNEPAVPNSTKPEAATTPQFEVLARMPVNNPNAARAAGSENDKARRNTDPLRETLAWPMPETVHQELLRAAAAAETAEPSPKPPQS